MFFHVRIGCSPLYIWFGCFVGSFFCVYPATYLFFSFVCTPPCLHLRSTLNKFFWTSLNFLCVYCTYYILCYHCWFLTRSFRLGNWFVNLGLAGATSSTFLFRAIILHSFHCCYFSTCSGIACSNFHLIFFPFFLRVLVLYLWYIPLPFDYPFNFNPLFHFNCEKFTWALYLALLFLSLLGEMFVIFLRTFR